MQKGMRFSPKSLEMGGSTANMQFISDYKLLFYPIAANEMYFCTSTAQKQNIYRNSNVLLHLIPSSRPSSYEKRATAETDS
ncbi:hypothetical protein EHV15_06345 [Paenibacillus oralis]|uniref:Uncharacterized protein n=1 Tax=Paenibacillus oralis TaxID=2490856 RepID=A0A3P3TXU3_9BACL|nr:hypothetical protein [Paenibacillus oralis]RRJ62604.1 hypothetical protein EHV15_06345 [Paenibacillus oralis]